MRKLLLVLLLAGCYNYDLKDINGKETACHDKCTESGYNSFRIKHDRYCSCYNANTISNGF